MRHISLIAAILGICVLFLLLNLSAKNVDNIDNLKVKERVILEGVVDGEKIGNNYNSFNIGNVSVRCYCKDSFNGKNTSVNGYVEEYNGKRDVRALTISVIE